jgi:hypothetical protein
MKKTSLQDAGARRDRAARTAALNDLRAGAAERKARFDAAHREGMKALAEHDYDKLSEAIQRERAVLEEQQAAIQERQTIVAAAQRRATPKVSHRSPHAAVNTCAANG